MPLLAVREFLLVSGLGMIVAGLTAYIMTWMLVAVHLRDHHPAERRWLGGFLFSPRALGWYLGARYRRLADRQLNAVAVLASIGAWVIVAGGVTVIISKLISFMDGGA
ncbi:hypothetical protein [Dokdonella sp.]|uniref:hypothetical protein n=1 Tax=Dokdonella sp. TaxID=2291710 RepID=UPI0031C00218|nr:hypothetical protein [Dokdonella sp.]